MSRQTSTAVGKTTASMTPQATPSQTPVSKTPMVPHEKIAMRAYDRWCQRGCPEGTDQQNWLEAEAELKTEMAKANTQAR